jgi:hypothetical protein
MPAAGLTCWPLALLPLGTWGENACLYGRPQGMASLYGGPKGLLFPLVICTGDRKEWPPLHGKPKGSLLLRVICTGDRKGSAPTGDRWEGRIRWREHISPQVANSRTVIFR